jgi:hypothetical protein
MKIQKCSRNHFNLYRHCEPIVYTIWDP